MKTVQDQHFLKDNLIFDKIIKTSRLNKEDVILEIGAGDGRLTKLIVDKVKAVEVVEIDEKFIGYLDELKNLHKNLTVHFGNALDFIDKLRFNKIVSNIPYSITEPLFKELLKIKFDLCVFIIGKNFHDLIKSKESKWSLIIPEFFDISLIETIPRDKFEPKPRVDSVLIKIKESEVKNKNLRGFILQDDKKVKNAIVKSLRDNGLTNKQAKDKLTELNIPGGILEKSVDYLSNKQFFFVVEKLKEN